MQCYVFQLDDDGRRMLGSAETRCCVGGCPKRLEVSRSIWQRIGKT